MNESQKLRLYNRALTLSWLTVVYNIVEGVVSVIAAAMAGSIALLGFGLDSFAESLSGGIMVWRFSKGVRLSAEEEERIEKKAERLVAYSFIVLGLYILFESIKKLVTSEVPEPSLAGIIIAIISIILMPVLYHFKMKTAKALNSRSLVADAKETIACMMLSVAVVLGLGLNYVAGIWQADPVAGILITGFLFKEGYEILSGKDED